MARNPRNDTPRVGVVIAAGGTGRRFGGGIPKQFARLGAVPVLRHTVSAFQRHPQVDSIVVAAPRSHIKRLNVAAAGFSKVTRIVPGGATRQGSVWNGLSAFDPPPDVVLVHDAVRPLVTQRVISEVIAAALSGGAAVVGVRVIDTIAEVGPSGASRRTLDRSRLYAVQTPQGFVFELLLRAHRSARRSKFVGTDEASLVQRIGIPVRIVEGERSNLKITTVDDLKIARIFLKKRHLQK